MLIFVLNYKNMLIKYEFKLEMVVAIRWSYNKWWISIFTSTVPMETVLKSLRDEDIF